MTLTLGDIEIRASISSSSTQSLTTGFSSLTFAQTPNQYKTQFTNTGFPLCGKVKELKPVIRDSVRDDEFDALFRCQLTFKLVHTKDEISCISVIVDAVQAAATEEWNLFTTN